VLPPKRPRLIALDLDGTLLDQLEGPCPQMLEALQFVQAQGIQLAFLTGRRPKTTRMGLQGFDGPAYIATNSGCLTWRYPSWERLGRRTLGADLVQPLIDLLAPYTLNLYCDAGVDDTGVVHLKRECTPQMELSRELFGYARMARTDICGLDLSQVTQIGMPAPRELVIDLQQQIRERFGERVLALCVGWPLVPCHALEVFAADAHKGNALAGFALREGIAQDEVLAVGDDTNDITMLDWAGWGVVMPHANEETGAAANARLKQNGSSGPALLAEYLTAAASM
jgi:hydroxymethylpyrimidine pyrophosphatase-like HAD family hydrolase